jgi:hypothetical protein
MSDDRIEALARELFSLSPDVLAQPTNPLFTRVQTAAKLYLEMKEAQKSQQNF